ncbi:glycosyltransferase family 39 protein [Phototrophicus methaneseepsis]|uniref:Glycosyltransferase family 39 protein n=1 Tax=Phototrophicus methaneseepsis TaxID=2710758 RepID=A0A7S8EAU4_9CHLR|nr:glycosyltransferase family 39 protein [Phototrophicus methaneseepsis]QPC83557.1 glycosyltransferase family 39 protein [Phototrophicus methaneseepsis]
MAADRTRRQQYHLVLFLIILIAGALRLSSYDFSLPYIDQPDEPNYYLEALKWRGYYEPGGDIPGYPPGILTINSFVQILLGDDGVLMPVTVQIVRMLSLTINLLTLVIIALIARRLAGPIAGLIAAFSWGIAPLVVSGGVYATADPYTYCFTVVAVWLALIALQDPGRSQFAIWSVAAGLLAVLFKYPALPALLPGFCVTAYFFLTAVPRRWLILLGQFVLVGVIAAFLMFIYQAGRMDIREADTLVTSGWQNVLNPAYILNNLYYVFVPIGGIPTLILIIVGLAIAFYNNRMQQKALAIVLCLLPLVGVPWLAASFSVVSTLGRIKDVLPATALACALLGLAIIEIGRLFRTRRTYATAILVATFAIIIWVPQFLADIGYIQSTQPPDRRAELRQWADQNIPAGTVLVGPENHKTFNPSWSGLVNNRQWFDWIVTDDVLEHTPAQWRDEYGISYLALEILDYNRLTKAPEGQAFLDDLFLLRALTNPPPMRGPEVMFYRLWPPQHITDIAFGEAVHLVGYDVAYPAEDQNPSPGTTMTFTFYWQASSKPAEDYSMFLHLVPAAPTSEAAPTVQHDGPPVRLERPTYTWDNPSEVLISQPITLTLPDDINPGSYQLRIGLYNWETLVRLPITLAGEPVGEAYELVRFDISP